MGDGISRRLRVLSTCRASGPPLPSLAAPGMAVPATASAAVPRKLRRSRASDTRLLRPEWAMESAADSGSCQLAAPPGRLYLRGVPLLPESLRGRAVTIDDDPFRYLRGVLAFLLGGGTVVALLLALTGMGA